MSSSRWTAAAFVCALACGRAVVAPAPAPTSISPSAAHTTADVPVTIHGSRFYLSAARRVGGGINLDSTFRVWLGSTPLSQVVWVDEQTLRAVVPQGLSGGVLDLIVEGPNGRGILAGAFRASPLPPPSLALALSAPGRVEMGQTFGVKATVSNQSAQDVQGLAVSLVNAAGLAVTAAAQNAAAFTYSAQASVTGSLTLAASATALDAFTGETVVASSPPLAVRVLAGPALRVVAHSLPAAVDVGQTFEVAADVFNDGDVDALGVQLATPVSPVASLAGAAPAAQDVPAGTMRTFRWSMSGAAAGPLYLFTAGSGADALTGLPLALQVTWPPSLVQKPARLQIDSFIAPGSIDRGQAFTATLTVRNAGEATASVVLPSPTNPTISATGGAAASTSSAQAPVTVAGGQTAKFTWNYTEAGTGSGSLNLSVGASATDANSGAVISAAPASAAVVVQSPASLSARFSAPSLASVGQNFSISLQVSNSGEAAARSVLPQPLALTGPGALTLVASPSAQDVPGLGSATFTWKYTASAAGAVGLSTTASGQDQNTGAGVSASASAALQVQRPAALRINGLSLPARISRGQTFTATLSVTNTGEAAAANVFPTVPTVTVTGGAAATTSTAPAAVTLQGGASATFSWTYTENGSATGTLALSAGVTGSDANYGGTGGALSAGPVSAGPAVVERPALLAVRSISLQSVLSRGQSFTVTMIVDNGGDAVARGVLPTPDPLTLTVGAAAHASTSTVQQPVDVPGGGSATFSWTHVEDGTGDGTLQFTGSGTGRDANSGAAVVSASLSSPAATVQKPAQLAVTALSLPAAVSRGQSFTATIKVSNLGEATALQVLPSPLPPPASVTGGAAASTSSAPAAASIPGGGSVTFTLAYTENGTGPGSITLSTGAQGLDQNSGNPVSAATLPSNACTVQNPAALAVTALTAPAVVSVGQTFTVSATVADTGQAAANGTVASPPTPSVTTSGAAAATTSSSNAPVNIAGGQSATLSWSYTATGGSGSLSFSVGATAKDANSGAAVSAPPATASTQVQRPAALSVTSFSAPSLVTRGQQFTATLTVANTGEATALAVAPSVPAVATTGGAAATTSSTPAAVTIPGGQSATFSWVYLENGTATGTLQLSAGASGTDANSSATVSAASAQTPVITVQAASQLVIQSFTLPSTLTRGQTFSVTMAVRNAGGTAVNNVLPSPSPPTLTTTGGAQAAVQGPLPPAVASLAPSASTSFVYTFVENGTGPGTLAFSGAACGTDAVSGLPSCSNSTSTATSAVQSPPALSVTSFRIPATLSRGQNFTATMVVSNSGGATAQGVVPSAPTVSGVAHASVVSAPSAAVIPGGGTATFNWTMVEDGTSAGALTLTSNVTGSDANSAASVSSAPASSNTSAVQAPAALAVASCTAPSVVSRGQSFTVAMVVTNTGQASASQVRPSPASPPVTATGGAAASTSSPQSPVTLAGGQSATFSWTFQESGTGPGTLAFSCSATGTDANSSATLNSGSASASTTVQQAAALAVTSFTLRSSLGLTTIDRGQTFVATLTVANNGQAAAAGVLPSPSTPGLSLTGGAGASTTSSLTPATIAGGASATFTWTYLENGTGPGTLQLSTGAAGTDVNSAAAVSAPASASNALTVQTAPALTVVSFTAPATISRGQTFTVSLTVKNGGGATATSVAPDAPAIAVTGGPHATTSSAQTPATLASGASATFTWSYVEDGTSTGTLSFTTRVNGTDSNTGAALAAVNAGPVVSTVQLPAILSISSLTAPAVVSRGQTFPITLVVSNTGQAAAANVVPSPNPPSAAPTGGASVAPPAALTGVSIAGGSSATFTINYLENGTGPGTLAFTAGASGTDANSSAALSAAAAHASTTVQRPAALSVTSFTLRSAFGSATIDRGQGFTASLTVTNGGDAAANGVVPAAPTVTSAGGASATTSSSPPAITIAGGASATFRWTYVENGTAPGTLRLSTSATGSDANSGATVSTGAAQSDVATVQAPAALTSTISGPTLVLLFQVFTVTLTVNDIGGAAVNALAPSSFTVNGATVVSGPTPASANVAGGGSVSFSWTCQAGLLGTVSFSASAAGTDANNGAIRFTSASSSTVASEVSQFSDPFGDGTTFAYLFDFNGYVYLGPNKSGTFAVRGLPDGTKPEKVSFSFNGDPGQKNANTSAAPYPSLGYTGCSKNTPQCGPDNEDGRGLLGSGVIAGTPWLITSGSISSGGLAHVYLTPDTVAAPVFDFIGMKNVVGSQLQGTSAMAVFHDVVYFGFPSSGSGRPFMVAFNRTPVSPGYDAASADAADLTAGQMPGMGSAASSGGTNSAATQMIDAFAVFNDRLYLGNNGGWMRSTNTAPRPYASSPADWAVSTPSAAAYGARTSVTTSKLADLLPSDRALPQMAVLGGKLYAARNTTVGPQLWACAPGANQACDPANWTLLAPNTSGDTLLSQFNDAHDTSVTLLAATPSHLYVGFDDAIDGVRIYRSTTTTPASMGDFTGHAGCNASGGAQSCPGLGGNGLGAGATRIFDGRGLSYGGVDSLYLTAGTGTGALGVFRLQE